ncbi:phage head-tail joining protein [Glaciimonas soli]|uniref:GpW protein n=1 Tax=Glaciimonas soli TaxID=2590999 RepID=A0A843YXD7_9BURK|nr:hypothetical protein [Glaciimonas soli]MQR02334.1 hypothetical protein [Glaciimonas soli]
MAVTQSDIDSLNAAIASGTRQVTLGGQSVTYQTTESLIKARDNLKQELVNQQAVAGGAVRSKRSMLYYVGRGYD